MGLVLKLTASYSYNLFTIILQPRKMDAVKCMKFLKSPHYVKLHARNCSITVRGSESGNDGFLRDFNSCHLATTNFQKIILGVGSAVVSLADPRRGDMIAAMGETTGQSALQFIRNKMTDSAEGRRILNDKPRITSNTVNLYKLHSLPPNTLGRTYANFLDKYGYSPDERLAVRFVDDIELAYVIQRYREVHDLFHTILRMPTNMLGEVTVKWVEAIQTRLPMCVGGAILGATRLAPKFVRHYSTQRRIQLLQSEAKTLEEDGLHTKKHLGEKKIGCVSVPEPIQNTIKAILNERGITDLPTKGKILNNYLRSRKPPYDREEIGLKRKEFFNQVTNELDVNVDMTSESIEYLRKKAEEKVNELMRVRMYNWKQLSMDDALSHNYLFGRAAADFAVISRVFYEIQLRNPDFVPCSLFDFGSGVGTVLWAAHAFWGSSIREYFTVDSSLHANNLALLILQRNNPNEKPFIQQLYQRQFLPATARPYDIVVSAFSLFELDGTESRLKTVSNLWNKTDKYLVLIEQGTNAGFQLISEARSFILHQASKSGLECSVFAPCPHELPCPRMAESRKTPCNFFVRYMPLKLKGNSNRSQKEFFSYLIMQKGSRSQEKGDEQWPRIVREVLRRHKHTICRLCTSKGCLEEVIISPGKHGKLTYKCTRRASWGDRLPIAIEEE